ncbi:MAG TPA: hypothetical protein VFC74_02500 [Oscillospiraceae bacterium]|nr:hypothetical protein [Oscillospiraceae bacterium]
MTIKRAWTTNWKTGKRVYPKKGKCIIILRTPKEKEKYRKWKEQNEKEKSLVAARLQSKN